MKEANHAPGLLSCTDLPWAGPVALTTPMWLLWVIPALALLVALGLWFFKIAFALPPPKELQRTPPGGSPRSVPDPRGPGDRAAK